MSDERDDPAEQLKQGLGLLWRAARGAASGIRKDMDRSRLGRTIDTAGRELVRAASNVVTRLGTELQKAAPPADAPPHADAGGAPQHDETRPADEGAANDAARENPAIRIAVDDDASKDREPR